MSTSGDRLIEVLFTVNMEREIWDFIYTVRLIKGLHLLEVVFTVIMGREIWDFVYCLLNKGYPLNKGAFYSKYGKRNLGLGLLSA